MSGLGELWRAHADVLFPLLLLAGWLSLQLWILPWMGVST